MRRGITTIGLTLALLALAASEAHAALVRPTVTLAQARAEQRVQAAAAFDARFDGEARLNAVADRLLAANLALCPDKRGSLGLRLVSPAAFPTPLRTAAKRRLGSAAPQVWSVVAGGAAAKAGVAAGDVVTAIDGRMLDAKVASYRAAVKQLADGALAPGAGVTLALLRGGAPATVRTAFQPACAYAVEAQTSDDLNAFADGRTVTISTALLRFARSDDELAFILAHELAHNILKHTAAQARADALDAQGQAALAAQMKAAGEPAPARGQNFSTYMAAIYEEEADYVGLYLAARAGFDISGVAELWRRMTVEHPESAFVASAHPANPRRFVSINATVAQIAAKRAAGMPLVPDEGE